MGPANCAYCVRAKVLNTGQHMAKYCSGYLANAEVWNQTEFQPTHYVDFMPLVWTHHSRQSSFDLIPEVPQHLDILSTLEHDRRIFLETNPKLPKYMVGFKDNGIYKFTIKVFAEDAQPSQTFLYLAWREEWDSLDVFDEAEWEQRKLAMVP